MILALLLAEKNNRRSQITFLRTLIPVILPQRIIDFIYFTAAKMDHCVTSSPLWEHRWSILAKYSVTQLPFPSLAFPVCLLEVGVAVCLSVFFQPFQSGWLGTRSLEFLHLRLFLHGFPVLSKLPTNCTIGYCRSSLFLVLYFFIQILLQLLL